MIAGLTTRPATAEDQPFLRRLFADSRAALFAFIPLEGAQREALIEMQFRAQQTHHQAAYPGIVREIVSLDASPIGHICTEDRADSLHLIDIAVLSQFRGQGVGTELLRELQGRAKREAKSVTLLVSHENPARRLYERLGFVSESEDAMNAQMRSEP